MHSTFLHLYIHLIIHHSIYCLKRGSDISVGQPSFPFHPPAFLPSAPQFPSSPPLNLRSPGCGSRPPVRRRGCRGATGWWTAWWSGPLQSGARPAPRRSLAAVGTSACRRRWRQRWWRAWQRTPACQGPLWTRGPCCCGRWRRWTTPPVGKNQSNNLSWSHLLQLWSRQSLRRAHTHPDTQENIDSIGACHITNGRICILVLYGCYLTGKGVCAERGAEGEKSDLCRAVFLQLN